MGQSSVGLIVEPTVSLMEKVTTFAGEQVPPAAFYLFSYPRSGSNWLFSSLIYLFGGIKAEARIGPDPYPITYGKIGPESFWIQAAIECTGDHPLLVKSHDRPEIVEAIYPAAKRIYLLRDGRDALISYYFFEKALMKSPEKKTVLAVGRQRQDRSAITSNDVRFDPEEYVAFLRQHGRAWAQHAQSWMAVPGIFALRYEALKEDFEREITRIASFVDLPPLCTMQELREEYVEHAKSLLRGDNRAFHRKGVVGDWRNYCDGNIREILKSEIGDTLIALNYEKSNDW